MPLFWGTAEDTLKGTFSIREIDGAVLATAGSCHFRESVRSGSRASPCSYGAGQPYGS